MRPVITAHYLPKEYRITYHDIYKVEKENRLTRFIFNLLKKYKFITNYKETRQNFKQIVIGDKFLEFLDDQIRIYYKYHRRTPNIIILGRTEQDMFFDQIVDLHMVLDLGRPELEKYKGLKLHLEPLMSGLVVTEV